MLEHGTYLTDLGRVAKQHLLCEVRNMKNTRTRDSRVEVVDMQTTMDLPLAIPP